MKEMLTENLWLKLSSILIAFLLWLLILYTYDPAATADFNLNVDIVNGETISSLGKVYEVIEGKNVTIRVKANSSLVKTLRSTDFKATADISKLSPTFHANIDVVCTKSNNIDIRLIGNAKFLAVKLEKLVSKQFPVSVDKRGEAEEGFFVGSAIPRPNFITVSGGESSIKRIKAVKVRVDAQKTNKSLVIQSEPKAYDIDENEITTGSLKFSNKEIAVALNVFNTKSVPVIIKPKGHPYIGYAVESIHSEPKKVVVAGEKAKLDNIFRLTLPVDVDGEITDVETSIRLSDYLSEGLYLVDSDTMVNVKCKIVRMVTKNISVPVDEVEWMNEKEAFTYELIEEDKPLEITVKGLQKDLDRLTLEEMKPAIDVKDIEEAGEYSIEVKLAEIKDVLYTSATHVKVKVTELNEEKENEDERPIDPPTETEKNEEKEGETESREP